MAKYTLYFKMGKPGRVDGAVICHYYMRFIDNETDSVLLETTTTYTPVSVTPTDMNDWRRFIAQAARMRIRKELDIRKDIVCVCLNDKSWFLTKGEKANKTRMRAKNQAVETTDSGERLYTVAQVNGVWAIKKVETQLLSEEEAKTVLFKKIVNGED